MGREGPTRFAPPRGAVPHDTHSCGPCGWCDLAVGSDHGDPYVFPAGVAELEHVWIQAHRPRVRAPDHGVPASAPPLARQRRAGLQRARSPARRVRRPVPCATAPVRSRARFGVLGRGVAAVWLGHRPRRRRGRALDRAVRPRPRPRAPPRRRRPVPLRPRHGRRRRRVVAAARRGHGLRALGDRRARSARSAGSSRCSSSTPGGAPCATPSATVPPAARSSAGPPSRSACSASCTSPTATRSPSSATPATSRRPAARSATSPRACCSTCMQTPYVVVPLLALLARLRRPDHHRDARLPDPGPAGRAARQGARPHPRADDAPEDDERHQADAHAPPLDAGRRHRPRDGRPGLRQPGARGPRAQQASAQEGGRAEDSGSTCRHRPASPTRPPRSPRPSSPPRGRPDAPVRSSRRRTPRCRSAWSSSRCRATSPTRCPATRSSSPARCTRPAPRPATPWSSGSCR